MPKRWGRRTGAGDRIKQVPFSQLPTASRATIADIYKRGAQKLAELVYPADPFGLLGWDENDIGPDDHRAIYETAIELYGQQNSKRVEGRVIRALVVSTLGKRSYKLLGIEKDGAASARRDGKS